MHIDASTLFVILSVSAGIVLWGLSLLLVIAAFIRARRRVKSVDEGAPMPPVPVPAFALHLVPRLVIGGMIVYALNAGRGNSLNALCAAACAFVIIQGVAAGMFGLGRAMLAVACTAIFVLVEILIAGAIFAATLT